MGIVKLKPKVKEHGVVEKQQSDIPKEDNESIQGKDTKEVILVDGPLSNVYTKALNIALKKPNTEIKNIQQVVMEDAFSTPIKMLFNERQVEEDKVYRYVYTIDDVTMSNPNKDLFDSAQVTLMSALEAGYDPILFTPTSTSVQVKRLSNYLSVKGIKVVTSRNALITTLGG